jgi:sec-independent protein translocase protein TatA
MKIGPWEIGLILLIVLIIFGAGRLATIGKDLGKAIRGFKEETQAKPEKEASAEDDTASKKAVKKAE